MIESKKTKDTDKDSVTQSSLINLFKEVEKRLYPGMFKLMTRVFIIPTSRLSACPPRLPSRSHLKIRILVPYQGGREIQAGGIRWYFDDLK
jgi:hypothetical protein